MRKNKKTLLGLTALAAGCATLLSIPAFATESVKAIPAVTISTASSIESDNEIANTISITMESYDDLVSAGVISQETAAKMNAFAATKNKIIEEEFSRIASMSEQEQAAYYNSESNVFNMTGLEQMVKENVITQQEKDKIDAYYVKEMKQHMEQEIKSTADRYVKENIITQETADNMIRHAREQADFTADFPATVIAITNEVSTEAADGDTDTMVTEFAFTSVFNLDELVNKNIISKAQKEAIEASDKAYFESMEVEFATTKDVKIITSSAVR